MMSVDCREAAGAPSWWYLVRMRSGSMVATFHPLLMLKTTLIWTDGLRASVGTIFPDAHHLQVQGAVLVHSAGTSPGILTLSLQYRP